MSMPGNNWHLLQSMSLERSVAEVPLPSGMARRVLGYATPMRGAISLFVIMVVLSSATGVAAPLILKYLIDDGVTPGDRRTVVILAVLVALLAVISAVTSLAQRYCSARIGEGLIFNLRTQVFDHVLAQPIGFFTRTQTGALVSRLNNDVIGAQNAFTTVLSSVVSNGLSLLLILGAMASLSWQLTLGALALVPIFLIPARLMGARIAGLAGQQMVTNADMGAQMTERFNVSGALLVKLFGDPARDSAQYAAKASLVRDVGVKLAFSRAVFFVLLTFVAALATAMVYGFGGLFAISGSLSIGSLLALAALLAQLYGPLTAISNVRIDVLTAMVSFSRLFEVLDMPVPISDAPNARPLPTQGVLGVSFDRVTFRYPSADEVSLASLEGSSTGDRGANEPVISDLSFSVAPGELVALVGPSGAGKSTISSLVARLYDPTEGSVRIGGMDLREITLASLRDAVGVVTQDSHMFHDTVGSNLRYAAPGATDEELFAALEAAQVRGLIDRLPAGLDTVVGERGHRLSGGEKQRLAIARLLLKEPQIVILDEATAHLDSESEHAVQMALDVALAGRTAIVVAHRLSTIRQADQILVIDGGSVVQAGRHEELLAAEGLYADLYRTQFAQ